MPARKKASTRSRKTAGSQRLKDVGRRLEEEAQEIIDYLNDEVVPNVRTHSSKALRVAARKLNQFARYLDKARSRASS